jgi:periplasmic divalent cation tolerance protein
MARFKVVLMTAPNAEEASRIAEALVVDRLAACVNLIDGCSSVYRWQGKVVKDREVLMIAKTSAASFAALEKRVGDLHTYDVPEIVAFDLTALSPGYAAWLEDVLGGP